MVLAKNTTHTHTNQHTHKSYNRLNVQCTKELQQFVVVARSSTWSAAQDCSPTGTKTLTAKSSHRQSACIHCRTLFGERKYFLKIRNFRFRHVCCGHGAILYTWYNGYGAIQSTVTGYCAYCQHTIDIEQYRPRNIRCILLNTVHRPVIVFEIAQ